jgi:hypothetical protein
MPYGTNIMTSSSKHPTAGLDTYLPSEASYADMDLTKVKLSRKEGRNLGLYVEYQLGEGQGHAELTAQHHRPPHADLEACFARLVPHLCFLIEAVQGVQQGDVWCRLGSREVALWMLDSELHERPEFDAYTVTGYSYDEKGGVVLIGQRRLSNKKVKNEIAPREDLAPEQVTGMEYPFLEILGRDLVACDAEVKLYMAGKTGPMVVQGELDFEGEEEEAE